MRRPRGEKRTKGQTDIEGSVTISPRTRLSGCPSARCRRLLAGLSLIGVGTSAMAYHGSSGDVRPHLRLWDYRAISASSWVSATGAPVSAQMGCADLREKTQGPFRPPQSVGPALARLRGQGKWPC